MSGNKNRISVTLSDSEYSRLQRVAELLSVSNSLVLSACWNYSAGIAEHVAVNQQSFDGRPRPVRRNTVELQNQLVAALMVADGRIHGSEGDTMEMFPDIDISNSDDAA